MSTPTLTRAAELLEIEAKDLRLSIVDRNGEWGDQKNAREVHDEMMQVAADLRAMIAAAPQPPASVSQWPAWQPMRTAPRDGTPVLLLLNGSDIPHAARWLSGPDDPRATDETTKPGWYFTWDGYQVTEYDGPTYWIPLPPDPGEAAQPADVARLVDLLREAAATFRRYEALHRAKSTADGDAKAEANAAIAGRIEAALAAKGGA